MYFCCSAAKWFYAECVFEVMAYVGLVSGSSYCVYCTILRVEEASQIFGEIGLIIFVLLYFASVQ